MVEISLSGSGEGPGWATAPGYSTRVLRGPGTDKSAPTWLPGAFPGPFPGREEDGETRAGVAEPLTKSLTRPLGRGYSRRHEDASSPDAARRRPGLLVVPTREVAS
jgi:hypothetical protein